MTPSCDVDLGFLFGSCLFVRTKCPFLTLCRWKLFGIHDEPASNLFHFTNTCSFDLEKIERKEEGKEGKEKKGKRRRVRRKRKRKKTMRKALFAIDESACCHLAFMWLLERRMVSGTFQLAFSILALLVLPELVPNTFHTKTTTSSVDYQWTLIYSYDDSPSSFLPPAEYGALNSTLLCI